jgi:hypothetical protein
MSGSNPGGSCNPEGSDPTRLGIGFDNETSDAVTLVRADFLDKPSLCLGVIQEDSCAVFRRVPPALVAWLLMPLRSCSPRALEEVLTTK